MTKYEKQMSKMGKAMNAMKGMYKKEEAMANRAHEKQGMAQMGESMHGRNPGAAESAKCLKY